MKLFVHLFIMKFAFPLHGGFFITDTTDAKGCLDEWAGVMEEILHDKDQFGLKEMIKRNRDPCNRSCSLFVMPRLPYFEMPSIERMLHNEVSTFVHITNTGIAKKLDICCKHILKDYLQNAFGLGREFTKNDMF